MRSRQFGLLSRRGAPVVDLSMTSIRPAADANQRTTGITGPRYGLRRRYALLNFALRGPRRSASLCPPPTRHRSRLRRPLARGSPGSRNVVGSRPESQTASSSCPTSRARQLLPESPNPAYNESQVAEASPLDATAVPRQEIFANVRLSTCGDRKPLKLPDGLSRKALTKLDKT